MALIENLVVALGLRTQQFDSKLAKSKQKMKGFATGTASVNAAMGKLGFSIGGMVASLIGLSAISSKLRRAAEDLDALGKAASKLGVATDWLRAFQYAAGRAGINAKTLNMALQRMRRRLGEITALGKGEALNALTKLGLDAKSLTSMTPEKQLMKIADAFAKITKHEDKMALAAKLFDSEGLIMINLLSKGSGHLKMMYNRAEKLGLLFKNWEIASVEKMNDDWKDIKMAMGAVWTRLLVDIAPAIRLILKDMLDWVTSADRLGSKFEWIANTLVWLTAAMESAVIILTAAAKGFQTAGQTLLEVFRVISKGFTDAAFEDFDRRMKPITEEAEMWKELMWDAFSGKIIDQAMARLERVRREMRELALASGFGGMGEDAAGAKKDEKPAALAKGSKEAAVAIAKASKTTETNSLLKEVVDQLRAAGVERSQWKALIQSIMDNVTSDAGIIGPPGHLP